MRQPRHDSVESLSPISNDLVRWDRGPIDFDVTGFDVWEPRATTAIAQPHFLVGRPPSALSAKKPAAKANWRCDSPTQSQFGRLELIKYRSPILLNRVAFILQPRDAIALELHHCD